jgi:hypothetical protein
MVAKVVNFTREERARMADQCRALGITFGELVHQCTIQGLDELETDEHSMIRRYFEGVKGNE